MNDPNGDTSRLTSGLSHVDEHGNARMVDVSAKDVTTREATARGRILMQPKTLAMIVEGRAPKGDVLATARIAGIMAAKRTHELIPLCHPLPVSGVVVNLVPAESGDAVEIEATVRVTGQTGVEMEALTAVSVAALTVYDMCKAVERGMRIEGIYLTSKFGGRSGDYRANDPRGEA
ncbi:MAG: cyclic pyranopterin monophosphate synthase MoaC [Chloroflexi bacterium]|nr:cyclic pyranopterin monophosphate synthase MoaC [Chloroflexota bacterium]MQC16912.1 cyclic pyranopterin monophosphate synthase MoaC [Chloroflexota bacterium]